MKVLIVVASKHGSTREIAEALAAELSAVHLTVAVQDAATAGDPSGYDAVVFGSAIYAGNWMPAARQYAETYRAALARVPVWAFSSGPLGPGDDPGPHDDPHKLAAPLEGVPVREHRVFVGKLDKSHLGLGERFIVQSIHAPEGDFRDWEAIHAWGAEIAAALEAPKVG